MELGLAAEIKVACRYDAFGGTKAELVASPLLYAKSTIWMTDITMCRNMNIVVIKNVITVAKITRGRTEM